ncbi:tim23 [Acrasis kona]|uniref:Tim23 n=1 Tax=Acrasis kona TaxID=1008807 RepID=A0AAW2YTV8_9EUKA
MQHQQAKQPVPVYLDTEEEKLFDNATYILGRAYAAAAATGLVYGTYHGLKYGESGSMRIRLNAVLNATGKRMVTYANNVGVMVILHQSIVLSSTKLRMMNNYPDLQEGKLYNRHWERIEEDPLQSVIAGAATGALYRCMHSWRRIGTGAVFGAVAATLYNFWTDKITLGEDFTEKKKQITENYSYDIAAPWKK